MKRCWALILSIAMMISMCSVSITVPASAAENETDKYEQALSMMRVLGVLENDVIYSPDDNVYREDLAVYIAKLLKYDEINTDDRYFVDVPSASYGTWAINQLTKSGIFSVGNERLFYPENVADMNEVYKVTASILGYDKYAQMNGGYPIGYIKALKSAGINTNKTGTARLADVITVLSEAIQVQIYEPVVFTNGSVTMAHNGNTILSLYYDVYYDEGTIDAIGRMSVSNNKIISEDEIMISGKSYILDTNIYEPRYLSRYVKYFYFAKDNGEKVVKLIYPKTKKEDIVVSIFDIKSITEGEICYFDNDKEKNVSLYGFRWVYNGRPLETKLTETLKSLNKGFVSVRDSDYDMVYDTIILWNYSNFVVSHIDKSRDVIYNKLKEAGRIDFLDNKLESVWIYDEKENKLTFDDIAEGNTLSVAKSNDGTILNVIVSMTELNGTMSNKSGKSDTLIINGNEYKIEPSYKEEFTGLALKSGEQYRYKIDPFGYVAYVYSGETDSVMKFGYITDSVIDDSIAFSDGVLKLRILTLDDCIKEFTVAKRVKIDGQLLKDAYKLSNAFPGGDLLGNIPKQMIRYGLNSDNEINLIDTLYLNPVFETENNSITSIGNDETRVRWYVKGRLGQTAYLDDKNTVVFCRPLVPLGGEGSEITDDEYSVGKPSQHFKTNYYRYTRIYTSNVENGFAEAILYDYEYKELDKNLGYYIDVIMVDSITEELDSEGTIVKCINGMTGGKPVSYQIPDNVSIGDVDKGDLIQLRFGIRNQVIPCGYAEHEDYTNPQTDIIVLYDYSKYNSSEHGGHPYDWPGNKDGTEPDRLKNSQPIEGGATTLYEDKSNESTGFYRAQRQLSFGYVLEKSETENQIWWSYKKDVAKKNETFRLSDIGIIVYDRSLPEEKQIYIGTIDDIEDAKNMGIDSCSKVILHTSVGEPKNLFVYR